MKNFLTIAYYTNDELYRTEANFLIGSLKDLGMKYHIKEIESRGGWNENTNYKPFFIKDCLEKFQCPVLYVDVDARFRKYPKVIDDLNCDFACHVREGHELLTGTLYFQPNERALKLIEEWIRRINTDPLVWEQRHLQNALFLKSFDLYWEELPANYCQIFDIMKDSGEPVIEHFQASRRYNNGIKQS